MSTTSVPPRGSRAFGEGLAASVALSLYAAVAGACASEPVSDESGAAQGAAGPSGTAATSSGAVPATAGGGDAPSSGGSTQGVSGSGNAPGAMSGGMSSQAGAAEVAGMTSGGTGASGEGAGADSGGGSSGEADGGSGQDAGGETSGGDTSDGGAAAGMDAGGSGGQTAFDVSFTTVTLTEDFYSEGADVADINGDGILDLVGGPRWYAGPDFELGGELFDAPSFTRDQYSTFFLTFADDLNGDTYPDVIAIGDAGGGNGSGTPNAHWYENPGPDNLDQEWQSYPLFDGLVANESPAYLDLLGDEQKELVFMTDRQLGYARPGNDPTAPWTFVPISGNDFNTPYVHGLGVGDIDGDGANDVVERSGWWRQVPAQGGGEPSWERNEVDFGDGLSMRANNWGGSEIYVYDVNGDGANDVVTALAAHQYGLSWFEQTGSNGFTGHEILPDAAGDGNFSQLHAMQAADLNGDGLLDIITGKRYYAHPSSNPDPGTTDPPVIYWFELSRSGMEASFLPHLIHDDSGVGCNFAVRDVNGDNKPDIFVSNKRGTFLHLQE